MEIIESWKKLLHKLDELCELQEIFLPEDEEPEPFETQAQQERNKIELEIQEINSKLLLYEQVYPEFIEQVCDTPK
jgi:hypothetical protein